MDKYIYHDAEKEKPEREDVDSSDSIDVLIFHGGEWDTGFFSYGNKNWVSHLHGFCRPSDWTSLPPDPPKPKRWVKKEARRIDCSDYTICPRIEQEVTFLVPRSTRNAICTYEVEEEQP